MSNIFESFGIQDSERYRFIINSLIIEGITEITMEKKAVKTIVLRDVKFLSPENHSLIDEADQLYIKLDSVSAFWAV